MVSSLTSFRAKDITKTFDDYVGLLKTLDEFGGEIDAVRPCNRVRLQREIFKGIVQYALTSTRKI